MDVFYDIRILSKYTSFGSIEDVLDCRVFFGKIVDSSNSSDLLGFSVGPSKIVGFIINAVRLVVKEASKISGSNDGESIGASEIVGLMLLTQKSLFLKFRSFILYHEKKE